MLCLQHAPTLPAAWRGHFRPLQYLDGDGWVVDSNGLLRSYAPHAVALRLRCATPRMQWRRVALPHCYDALISRVPVGHTHAHTRKDTSHTPTHALTRPRARHTAPLPGARSAVVHQYDRFIELSGPCGSMPVAPYAPEPEPGPESGPELPPRSRTRHAKPALLPWPGPTSTLKGQIMQWKIGGSSSRQSPYRHLTAPGVVIT